MEEEIKIFGKNIKHGISETEEEQTYYVFYCNNPEIAVIWYYKQDNDLSNTWQPFKEKPSFDLLHKKYSSSAWTTDNKNERKFKYKIKAVIKSSHAERELCWNSD
ncbi:MAG: hypothetical protein KKC46_02335 [Proteobacteria bacterium]|nr:hypothetical protein [Pseudomonadota bacterium]